MQYSVSTGYSFKYLWASIITSPPYAIAIEFQFNQSMYTVSEAAGSLSVCIQLVGGNLSQQVNVAIESQDGTATGKTIFHFISMM